MTGTMHEQLSDRMPEVARGSATWTAAEAEHLAGCADCQAEWRLVAGALRLGDEVERSFDAGSVANVVAARLKSEPVAARRRFRPLLLLATAAALAILFARPATPPVAGPDATEIRFLPELDSLSVEELALVADGFDAPLTETRLIDGQPAPDLDTTQLQRVLRSLEG